MTKKKTQATKSTKPASQAKASKAKAKATKATKDKVTKKAKTTKAAAPKAKAKKKVAQAAKKITKKAAPKVKPSAKASKSKVTQAKLSKQAAPKTSKKKSPIQAKAKKSASSKAKDKPAAPKRSAAKRPAKKSPAQKTMAPQSSTTPSKKAKPAAAAKKSAAKKATKKAPLTLEETPTEDLWGLYRTAAGRKGSKAKDKLENLRNILMERHYPLVRYIAERLLQTLPKSIELDDLISAGLFGLMDAIRGFDADRGIKFKTYCSTRIRGAILDQLRSQDWVPRLVRLKASKIDRALQKLTAEYGREPTHAELARTLDMEHADLSREIAEANPRSMFSLSEKWEDDDGSVEKVEILEDKTSTDPVTELNRRDLMGFITRALTHKERFIIEQYYQYGHTMREIGEMLALTESRVCQIHSNVMSRLKGLLGQKQGSLLS